MDTQQYQEKEEVPTAIGKEIPITNAENINTLTTDYTVINNDTSLYVNGIEITEKLIKVYQRAKTIRYLSIFHMIINIINCFYNLFFIIFVLFCYSGYYGAKNMKINYTRCYNLYCILNLLFNFITMIWIMYYRFRDYGLFIVLTMSIIVYTWIITITTNFIKNLSYDLTKEEINIIKYFNKNKPPYYRGYVLI